MQKLKKVILILIIIIICIIGIIFVILQTKNKTGFENIIKTEENNNNIITNTEYSEVKFVSDYNQYFIVQDCIGKFIQTVKESEPLYIEKILDSKYIKDNNINIEEMSKILDKYNFESYGDYVAEEMSYIYNNKNYLYFVKGKYKILDEYDDNKYINLNIIVHIDINSETFKIIPEEPPKNLLAIDDIYLQYLKENIEYDSYNTYSEKNISEETMAKNYFMSYIILLQGDLEKAYNTLDDKYKEEKFENIDEFKKYIKDTEMTERKFKDYTARYGNEYKIFIIQDNNGREYIFKENLINSYTVMLDDYTTKITQITNSYKKLTNREKAEYNVENFIQMINNNDYKQAYSYIDETYRENNFSTQEKFITYIKEHTYENNSFEVENIEKLDDYYLVKVKLNDKNEENTEEKELSIIMKLENETDFKISFQVI